MIEHKVMDAERYDMIVAAIRAACRGTHLLRTDVFFRHQPYGPKNDSMFHTRTAMWYLRRPNNEGDHAPQKGYALYFYPTDGDIIQYTRAIVDAALAAAKEPPHD